MVGPGLGFELPVAWREVEGWRKGRKERVEKRGTQRASERKREGERERRPGEKERGERAMVGHRCSLAKSPASEDARRIFLYFRLYFRIFTTLPTTYTLYSIELNT